MGTKDSPVSPDPPVLYAISSDRFPLGPADMPPQSFSMRMVASVPLQWTSQSALLVPFPEGKSLCSSIPKAVPFLAYGDSAWMEEAFAMGAADYLRTPIDPLELNGRVARTFNPDRRIPLPGTSIFIRGGRLHGPAGSVPLNREESRFLRILAEAGSRHVSRAAVRLAIWPRLPSSTRVVDTSASRLRKHLRSVCGEPSEAQISSVRGFGYILVLNGNC